MRRIDTNYMNEWLGPYTYLISEDQLIKCIDLYNENLNISPFDHYDIIMNLYINQIDYKQKEVLNVLILKILNRFKMLWSFDEICDGYFNIEIRMISNINIQNIEKERVIKKVFNLIINSEMDKNFKNSLFFALIVFLNDEIYT